MRTMVVFNRAAGQAEAMQRELDAAATVWAEQGWLVEQRPTAAPGDGVRLAREAAERGFDLVVAAGGDGTINEVVNGLAGSGTALGTLPLGTMNVWARELGMPLQPRAAAAALLDWELRQIDLGRAGDRYFLLMAGIGLDAEITSSVRPDLKRMVGAFAYAVSAAQVAMRFRGVQTRIVIDGKPLKARVLMIVIGNSQLYGGLIKITNRASIDDGLLDVCVIKGDTMWAVTRHTIAILRQRHSVDPEIEYYRARSVSINARRSIPVQVDGDTAGTTPMTFTIAPGALHALMPRDLPEDLVRQVPIEVGSRANRSIQRLAAWFNRR